MFPKASVAKYHNSNLYMLNPRGAQLQMTPLKLNRRGLMQNVRAKI